MPFLNLDLDYLDHPKTKRLVAVLGKDADMLPIRLWIYCGKFHAQDGKLAGHSVAEIEAMIGWQGKQGEAVRALVHVGFLDRHQDSYRVHNWSARERQIIALKTRAVRAAEARWNRQPVAYLDAPEGTGNSLSQHQILAVRATEARGKKQPVAQPEGPTAKALSGSQPACLNDAQAMLKARPSNATSIAKHAATPSVCTSITNEVPKNERTVHSGSSSLSNTIEKANESKTRTGTVRSIVGRAGEKRGGLDHRPAAARSPLQKGEGKGRKPKFEDQDLGQLCLTILGKDEMARCGSRWRRRAENDPQKLFRVLVEMRASVREGKANPKNPGAYAEDLWKRFAP